MSQLCTLMSKDIIILPCSKWTQIDYYCKINSVGVKNLEGCDLYYGILTNQKKLWLWLKIACDDLMVIIASQYTSLCANTPPMLYYSLLSYLRYAITLYWILSKIINLQCITVWMTQIIVVIAVWRFDELMLRCSVHGNPEHHGMKKFLVVRPENLFAS